VARALRILAFTVPFASLLDTYTGASRGFHDMRPTVIVDRIGRSGLQFLGVAIAALTGAAAWLAPLWALPYVPAAILAWLWFRRIADRRLQTMSARWPTDWGMPAGRAAAREPGRGKPPGARATGFWRFTGPRAMASTAQVVLQRLDIVLVGIIRGPVDAAIYTAATRFLVVGQLGNIAISMAAQPQLARLFANHDRLGANAVYQATTAWLIILTWPLYLLSVVYGPATLAVFGHSYSAGAPVMVILGLTMLLTTACGQVDVVLVTAGRSSWSLGNWLLAVTINVSVDLALIPKYGIIGAAIGWAAALAIANLAMLAEVGAIVRVSPFGRGCLVACVIATVSFGAIPYGARMLIGRGPMVSGLAVLIGCALFAAGLWRFRQTLKLTAMPGLSMLARRA
jgi:O-antigen/teichoic acid export membrane protein